MIIETTGKYMLVKPFVYRTPNSTGTIPPGKTIRITQIDPTYRKVYGPELGDWNYWDLPVEPLMEDQLHG